MTAPLKDLSFQKAFDLMKLGTPMRRLKWAKGEHVALKDGKLMYFGNAGKPIEYRFSLSDVSVEDWHPRDF